MSCEKCGGSGFVVYRNEQGYEMAKACECRAKMITQSIMRSSGMSEAFLSKKLDGFMTKGSETLEKAKRMASDYIDNFFDNEKNTNNSIMFLGNPGSGKTHLSFAIGNELMEKGVSCRYFPYREKLTELKQLAMSDKYKYEELMHSYTTTRLLIIDDLYKGGYTDADLNYMFQIINQRYLNNLPFILSSERTPNEMMAADEAIASRLLEQAKGRTVLISDKKLNHRIYS